MNDTARLARTMNQVVRFMGYFLSIGRAERVWPSNLGLSFKLPETAMCFNENLTGLPQQPVITILSYAITDSVTCFGESRLNAASTAVILGVLGFLRQSA